MDRKTDAIIERISSVYNGFTIEQAVENIKKTFPTAENKLVKFKFVDEKYDDKNDDDTYVMMRSYNLIIGETELYIRLYYGSESRVVEFSEVRAS